MNRSTKGMNSHRKKMLTRLFIGASIALLGTAVLANPFVLDWRVIGFGQDTGTCVGSFMSGCTSTPAGSVQGTHIGSGTFTLSVTAGSDNAGPTDPSNHATNSSGGKCLPANNSRGLLGPIPGTVTAADGSTINFNTVGWLCQEAGNPSPYHYNGTYRITGGTGRFSTAVGGGSLTYTVDTGVITSNNSYMKIDGTINF